MKPIPVPEDLNTLYNSLLVQKAIPVNFHAYYRKWLRYYLDFCQKYDFRQSDTNSLMHFINKLKEKKQSDQQQKQAMDAISIFYGNKSINNGKNIAFKNKNDIISSKKTNFKLTGTNWIPVYNDFNFDTGILTVHDGKGKKDRTVPLPERIMPELKNHL